jgi:cell division septum initiation protein DivIVA
MSTSTNGEHNVAVAPPPTARRRLETLEPSRDVLRLLEDLGEFVDGYPQVLNKVWGMDVEEFHARLNQVRANLPDDLKKATRLSRESHRLIDEARGEADGIIASAQEQAQRMIEQARAESASMVALHEITKQAQERPSATLAEAEASAREVRRGAENYARDLLAHVENTLGKLTQTVRRGQDELRSE